MKTAIIRTSLTLAIIASVGIGALNLLRLRETITRLQTSLQTQTTARQMAESNLRRTQAELHTTAASLAETRSALETATTERQKALAEVVAQTQRMLALQVELQMTRMERNDALDELAPFRTAGLTAGEVLQARNEVKRLRSGLTAAQDENRLLTRAIGELKRGGDEHVRLPASLTGKVLVTDPTWQFVVLNVGATSGMLERGELLVSRAGKFVGKVKVTRVERDRAIGDVLPGSGLGEVLEGDVVIPAFPES